MASTRRARALLVVACLLAVGGLVASLVQGDDESEDPAAEETTTTTPTVGGPSPTPTAPEEPPLFAPEPIEWEGCAFGQCASLRVPLSYAEPDEELISLFVARVPARGERIGSLFVNPGGPGGTASTFAAGLSARLPDEITEHFDVVGVDPRGTGGSTPMRCGVPLAELYGTDATIEDDADRQALLDVSEAYVDDCTIRFGDLLPHVGTRDAARDIDSVREAMGDDQISYVGFSYGTAIGQVYADLYPGRVRAMVLDGVVELGPSGIELAVLQAAGFETALARWAAECATGCATSADPMGAVEQVLALSEVPGGIPAPGADRAAGPGEATLGVTHALYSTSLWGDLDSALAEALDGDGSALVQLADGYLGIAGFEVYFAVNCIDFSWPADPDAFFAAGKAAAQQAPHFGEAIVNDYIRCVDWPVEPQPLTAVTAPGTPPIVVVSTTGDPATPYEAGVALAERLETGVLVTHEGDGHTVVADQLECIDRIMVSYLVDLEAPDAGVTC